MPYKPDQLPFDEFSGKIREMKKLFDDASPHYPLVGTATDANGQLLLQQIFVGPFSKPAIQVLAEEDWQVPVAITFSDHSGCESTESFDVVTVRPESTDVQLPISLFQEEGTNAARAIREDKKRAKEEIEAKLEAQRKTAQSEVKR
jgi:hypothetical protein